jgi:thioredoxin reductase (NADPH)
MAARKIEMDEQAAQRRHSATHFDVLVIGAGPTGLACGIESTRRGLRTVLVDKGCLCNSLFHYPLNMTFFTTSELLEIGEIPFPSVHSKPVRDEALEYYRKVADHYRLDVRQYERVVRVEGADGDFRVRVEDRFGRERAYATRKLVVASGYYDLPNYLRVPGEALPKVMHYYDAPHPYFDTDVVVIGGKNSAAIAALELWRHGARVTLVHRGPAMHHHVKYWILPDIENRIKAGEIDAFFQSEVTAIREDTVEIQTPEGPRSLRNDFVFALTGYHPDFEMLESFGVRLTSHDLCPECDPATLESNVPGLFLAGVIVAGSRTNEIFIENGRFHGRQIAEAIAQQLASPARQD